MLVHLQVALDTDFQVDTAVSGNLFQHVVEESQSRFNPALSASVQVQTDVYIRFMGGASDLCRPFSGKKKFRNPVPVGRSQYTDLLEGTACHQRLVFLQQDGLAPQVPCQFHIRAPVADDETSRQVVCLVVQVMCQHAGPRFAGRSPVLRKAPVDQHLVEGHPFVLETFQNQLVHRPEGLFRKRRRTQTVLVGDHDKVEIQVLADKVQVAEYLGIKLQFLKTVQLIVNRWFDDQSTVAVDE